MLVPRMPHKILSGRYGSTKPRKHSKPIKHQPASMKRLPIARTSIFIIMMNLYNNDEAEDYPPHWTTPFEIIMPAKIPTAVPRGEQEYQIRARVNIPSIAPDYPSASSLLANMERASSFSLHFLRSRFAELDTSRLTPAILITPESFPQIHATDTATLEIRDEYFSEGPHSGTVIYGPVFLRSSSRSGAARPSLPAQL